MSEQASQLGKHAASDNGDSPDASDGKKRRAPSTSSRGVANLTPEQLAKKRQNDREAQRAIRERTKNQIDTLERRIQDLTSQQPYQELQHVIRQKEAVEAENSELKKRVASVMSTLAPIIGTSVDFGEYDYRQAGFHAYVEVAGQGPYAPPYVPQRPGSASNLTMGPSSTVSSPSVPNPHNQWQLPGTAAPMESRNLTNNREFHQQRQNLVHGLDMGPERLGLEFLLDGNRQNINRVPSTLNGNQETGQNFQCRQDMQRDSPNSGSVHSSINGQIAAHAALPRNGPATCPLDQILLDFLYERQKQAAEGVATPKLVGPAYPSVSSLLNPAHSVNSHPLSKVFTDILGTFPDLSTLPEKIAVLYIMFLIMRWQVSPTQENYDRLPDWVTPRPSQLFTPHPAWVDHLPFPRMRDKLVRECSAQEYLFENFFIPFTTTLSLNWPYEPTDTLLSSADCEELMINPVFERHLRRIENWSLGPAFDKAFPGLQDTYRLKTEGDRRV